ncbi:ATP-dependent RNA helicase CHL1, partial [Hortaea werneckii]
MARKDFHHPFQPYDIQQQFMEAMYECIEEKKVGIFESPTGTGKSLSLICSSLTWLREHKRKAFDEAVAAIEVDDDEPDWMANAARDARRQEIRQMRDDFEKRLQAVREREQKIREKAAKNEPLAKRRKVAVDEPEGLHEGDDQFLLDDYDSDDEHAKDSKNGVLGYSAETTKLMEQLGMLQNRNNEQVQEETPEELKIFFCSRTHSQLSQFVGELQRVKLPAALPSDTSNPQGPDDTLEHLKQLSLGSRKNMCINPKVSKLGNQTAINERCIELQQGNTPKEQKCPFLPDKEKEDILIDFRDHALARVRDIEDLTVLGSKLGVCPYYASRPAIKPAEMVTLPYPLLLQKTARDALDISVKDQVVVIDEAHNLMDAIEGIHSGQISEAQLKLARESLIIYLQKFRNRLKGSNRVYVTQVVRVIDSILNFTNALSTETSQDGTLGPGQLLSGKGVDQINLAKLVRYISDSKLARKVQGYVASLAKTDGGTSEKQKAAASTPDVPTLTHVQNFLV